MQIINKKIFFNLSLLKVMSVYWSMYYLESFGMRKSEERNSKPVTKKKMPKVKVKAKIKLTSAKKK